MRLIVPRMGDMHVIVAGILRELGHHVEVPPPVSAHTIALGSRHAPESVCLPCKVVLGGFLQVARRARVDGALMAAGVGPCRFGCYHRLHRAVLRRLGFDWQWFIARPPRGHMAEVLGELSRLRSDAPLVEVLALLRLGWHKMKAVEAIDALSRKVYPGQRISGGISSARRAAVREVADAEDLAALRETRFESLRWVRQAGGGAPSCNVVRVGMVGEIFTVMEPGANMQVQKRLGEMGARVYRQLRLTDWIKENIILDTLRLPGKTGELRRAAAPYLRHFVGGEGRTTVGRVVQMAEHVDGIVHVMPFTCAPEIIARAALRAVQRDHDIPILTLVFDEHCSPTGVQTRLEAFVDMLRKKKEQKR